MRFEFKVATKYLYYSKLQTLLLVAGVALGVVVFIFITSLMNGLAQHLFKEFLANLPHILLEKESVTPTLLVELANQYENYDIHEYKIRYRSLPKPIRDWRRIEKALGNYPGIKFLYAQISGEAFLKHNENIAYLVIKGVAPEKINSILEQSQFLGNKYLNPNSIIMGEFAARELGLIVGQPVLVQSQQGISRLLTLQGVFKTGINFMDRWFAYTDLKTAQALFGSTTGVTSISIQLKNIWEAKKLATEIEELFQLKATAWQENNSGIWESLTMQNRIGNLIRTFSLLVIMIGVFSSLLLSLYRRKSEIGIMRSFGMTKKFITNIFLLQGLIIGSIGALCGTILGYLLCLLLSQIKTVNDIPLLPLLVTEGGYLMITLLTITGSGIAAIIPAKIAANIDPVECIEQP